MSNNASNSVAREAYSRSLRPTPKPVIHKMTASFINAFPEASRQSLKLSLERIFLRLGFNRYQGESSSQGLRIRIDGRNIATGKQNDYHVVYRDSSGFNHNFEVLVTDRGHYYNIHYLLASGL